MNLSYTSAEELPTVVRVFLSDRVHSVCDRLIGKGVITPMDLENYANLVLKVDKVQLVDRFGSRQPLVGTLYITTTHLIFVSDEGNKETWILHSHVASVERGQLSVSGCPLNIRCKTFRYISFLIQRDKDCQEVFETLQQLSRPMNIEDVYAFSYVPASRELNKSEGWDYFDIMEDYMRMGIPNDYWVVTDFNLNYAAAICRCSQPLAGFSARCMEDEEMMQHIMKANPNCNVLYVMDTRPKINAMANKMTGKGFEDARNYANIRFHFFEIENIHVMRNSLQKLVEVSSNGGSMSGFLSGLEGSGWLRHVRAVLDAGNFMADSILRAISCVVHCSDGWDRTSQTISIASILIDPYYRTIKGFQALIEKDWLAFGHKFSDRFGHTGSATGVGEQQGAELKELSPIFTQFLDCVWQLMCQYPRGFEFNERFLIDMHDDVTSCQFGTFLGNCDKDRRDLRLPERTYSLWGYMEKLKDNYVNPLFQGENARPWKPDLRPQAIRFWRTMYNRFELGIHPRESIEEMGGMLKDHIGVLKDHLNLLQRRVGELRLALGKTPKSPTTSHSVMVDSGHSSSGLPANVADTSFHGAMGIGENSVQNLKIQSDSESGVEDPSLSSSDSSKGAVKRKVTPTLNQLACAGMSQSLTSLDLSFTDLCSSEVASVAVRWESFRKVRACNFCGNGFLFSDRKCHCYKCGLVFCRRCLDIQVTLPGLLSKSGGCPVCKQCYQDLFLVSPPPV